MKLQDRQALGKDIASLVIEAEKKFPGPGRGREKMNWCVRQARKRAPEAQNSSAEAAKWFGGMVLRLGVEIAVFAIKEYTKENGL